eukprot:m.410719 g.410719  ORF g.410719 m.410719 type:complete len:77 (+) comp28470_c0_seq1:2864-3094(+)
MADADRTSVEWFSRVNDSILTTEFKMLVTEGKLFTLNGKYYVRRGDIPDLFKRDLVIATTLNSAQNFAPDFLKPVT